MARLHSLHGGRWSFFQPINQLYVLSKTSLQTPGPGHYGELGAPDPVVTGKTTPFGKLQGGRVSTSALRHGPHDTNSVGSHAYQQCRIGKSVPGPGAYDTDHLFGIYARIRAAIPDSGGQKSPTQMYEEEDFEHDSDSTPRGSPSPTYDQIGGFPSLGDYPQSPNSPGYIIML